MTTRGIASDEIMISGRWETVAGKVRADEVCRRIEDLITNYLVELGKDASGWDRLFVDPSDGRYWELTYPDSQLHGGGPPRLANLAKSEAGVKYGHLKL